MVYDFCNFSICGANAAILQFLDYSVWAFKKILVNNIKRILELFKKPGVASVAGLCVHQCHQLTLQISIEDVWAWVYS